MTKVEFAINWCLEVANDPTHGYSQRKRWGPDYDCSSLIFQAYQNAGVPVMDVGKNYPSMTTHYMRQVFTQCGFEVIANWNKSTGAGLIPGDVVLNTQHHVEMYIGNGQLVKASSDEVRGIEGKIPGDQTGEEIHVGGYWNYPWDCALRYTNQTELYTGPPTNFTTAYEYAISGAYVEPNYEEIDPYIMTIDRNTKLLDFSEVKEHQIIAAVVEAGYLYDSVHLQVPAYVNPMLEKQVAALKDAELPYGLFAIVRARNIEEAKEELKWLRIYIQKYVPPLGVWLQLDLAGNVAINDLIIGKYQEILELSGLKGKIGFYVTRKQLERISWSKWKESFLLWLVDHVDAISELETILTPEFFMLKE